MSEVSRRTLMKATGVLGASLLPVGLDGSVARAQHDHQQVANVATSPSASEAVEPPSTYLFFNAEEAAFIEAAVARLIPADDKWGGAIEAGVPNYVDKQMVGAWGAGERLYRSGPWQAGTPSQGYQLPFTPAELFRTAIAAINAELKTATPFAQMSAEQQDAYLHELDAGKKDLGGVPSAVFFADLWELTVEGFFSDPVYGGNRNMIGWKMIGFPGAYASFYDLIDQYGITLDRTPVSLASDVHGHVHTDPNIPAQLP